LIARLTAGYKLPHVKAAALLQHLLSLPDETLSQPEAPFHAGSAERTCVVNHNRFRRVRERRDSPFVSTEPRLIEWFDVHHRRRERKFVMLVQHKVSAVILSAFALLFAAGSASAQQWELQLNVKHRAQQENWSCGPYTIAMWAGYLKNAPYDTNSIAKKYTGGLGDGTNIPEFVDAMHQLTKPNKYAEWTYINRYTAVKGVMATVAQFKEPVAISGNDGGHYYLVVGGVASKNPFVYYGKDSNIKYVYLLDSRQNSPLYTNPKAFTSAWWSVTYWPIFKKGQRYTPTEVTNRWTPIPWTSLYPKWRSVERVKNTKPQGAPYNNTDRFLSF
jgi:hypothetical protein